MEEFFPESDAVADDTNKMLVLSASFLGAK